MSTRSGKRIHSLFTESSLENSEPIETMSERKTRSRKHKENQNYEEASVSKKNIRDNYVSYPVDEEDLNGCKASRSLRKNTILKEINLESIKDSEDVNNVVRETRRTKKFIVEEKQDEQHNSHKRKAKKSKKKKSVEKEKSNTECNEINVSQKKTKTKKKKRSSMLEIKEIQTEPANQSLESIDSYCTAVGSPEKKQLTPKTRELTPKTKDMTLIIKELTPIVKELTPRTKEVTPKIKESTPIIKELTPRTKEMTPRIKEKTPIIKELTPRTKEMTPNVKELFPIIKELTPRTKEKSPKTKENTSKIKELIPQINGLNPDISFGKLNGTYDKISDPSKLDSTFNKSSSLISSDEIDNGVNMTFDKVNTSAISITSDDSKTSDENIINTTPLLIESSLDNSNFDVSNKNNRRSSEPALLQRQGTFTKEETNTTLQREGTFTKDGPDPIIVSPPKLVTPRKGSLPTAGHTPYHSNAKKREKSVNLNLTHSVEKPVNRRSSCLDLVRQTKVMFCSPVNNPITASARKSRIIKSSMKGSNKSFLFDDSLVAGSTAMPKSSRKRSLTHGDADDRAKRARLTEDLANSVKRLSRPRTVSAIVKPTQQKEPTTPSKKSTPIQRSESVRSKLPNFAALHQRRFNKMESLDECQERKAKRAKQLLSPSGSLTVLERKTSKVGETSTLVTKTPINPKKIDTPTKTAPKTLLDLKPGYTRFGFKVNYHVNPFSVPPKAEPPTLKRVTSQPSLKGTTLPRKEVAKQTIMREKSFNLLKEKRNEYRNIIKGVRTNRRFELQMRSRNINS